MAQGRSPGAAAVDRWRHTGQGIIEHLGLLANMLVSEVEPLLERDGAAVVLIHGLEHFRARRHPLLDALEHFLGRRCEAELAGSSSGDLDHAVELMHIHQAIPVLVCLHEGVEKQLIQLLVLWIFAAAARLDDEILEVLLGVMPLRQLGEVQRCRHLANVVVCVAKKFVERDGATAIGIDLLEQLLPLRDALRWAPEHLRRRWSEADFPRDRAGHLHHEVEIRWANKPVEVAVCHAEHPEKESIELLILPGLFAGAGSLQEDHKFTPVCDLFNGLALGNACKAALEASHHCAAQVLVRSVEVLLEGT
mmetsp:Transcript_73140/g.202846  ORF Transcript_73140/g.202846 Transcript_73140/m.202846 type:complete len:307 (-) Transcript_73140:49-969(-)